MKKNRAFSALATSAVAGATIFGVQAATAPSASATGSVSGTKATQDCSSQVSWQMTYVGDLAYNQVDVYVRPSSTKGLGGWTKIQTQRTGSWGVGIAKGTFTNPWPGTDVSVKAVPAGWLALGGFLNIPLVNGTGSAPFTCHDGDDQGN